MLEGTREKALENIKTKATEALLDFYGKIQKDLMILMLTKPKKKVGGEGDEAAQGKGALEKEKGKS